MQQSLPNSHPPKKHNSHPHPFHHKSLPTHLTTSEEKGLERQWVGGLTANDSKCAFSWQEIQHLRRLVRELAYASALVEVNA